MLNWLLHLLGIALAVYVLEAVLPGMRLQGFRTALAVAAVYGLLNFVLFRLLIFVTFPLVVLKWLTLGLFGWLVNAVLLMLTARLVSGFALAGFGTALLVALGLTLANLALGSILR